METTKEPVPMTSMIPIVNFKMKSWFVFMSLTVLVCINFVSCSKDEEDNYSPEIVSYYKTQLFEVPYTGFGNSKEKVKSVLSKQTVEEESETKIVYKGKENNEFQVYYFESGKLIEAASFIKAKYEDYVYITAMNSKYHYWGETKGPISTFFGYVNSIYYYVAMTKQSDKIWMIDYVAHDRINYKERHSGDIIFKQIDLPKVIMAREYLPY